MVHEDTIAAIATPNGMGGVSVIRVSGPDAAGIAGKIVKLKRRGRIEDMKAWSVALGSVVEGEGGKLLDEVLVLFMKGPRSYTGSDTVELQCHGGRVVTEKILSLLIGCGARLAEPGEFTRRAFLNGRITLDEAEAVLDMVSAASERALSQASRRLRGELGALVRAWEEALLDAVSMLQGSIDFPKDIESGFEEVRENLRALHREMKDFLASSPLGLALSEGLCVCLAGRPNVGKSSLFNVLLSEERAIVTDIPGTTRDVLRERTVWAGIPVMLFDTAGLRVAGEIIEGVGVERAKEAASESQVVLYVVDDCEGISSEDEDWLRKWSGKHLLLVVNKTDLGCGKVDQKVAEALVGDNVVAVSALTQEGIKELKAKAISPFTRGSSPESVAPGNFRQVECVRGACESLSEALALADEGWTLDVVTVMLERAAVSLMEVTGKSLSEEMLDRVFSRFCVGK